MKKFIIEFMEQEDYEKIGYYDVKIKESEIPNENNIIEIFEHGSMLAPTNVKEIKEK